MKATGMEDNSEAKPLAQIERHSYSEVGWISRQNLLALRSRENFFLTSLFIELIDRPQTPPPVPPAPTDAPDAVSIDPPGYR
jgi:hypothetical protein